MNAYEAFGSRVRTLRTKLGWSMAHLAERVGVDKATVARAEAGQRRVTLEDLFRFALALDVAPASLLVPDDPEAAVEIGSGVALGNLELKLWIKGGSFGISLWGEKGRGSDFFVGEGTQNDLELLGYYFAARLHTAAETYKAAVSRRDVKEMRKIMSALDRGIAKEQWTLEAMREINRQKEGGSNGLHSQEEP